MVARAGGLDFDMLSARGVGRAGNSMVSEDGGAALLRNPAGLVRRLSQRAQAALIIVDTTGSFQDPDLDRPRVENRGPAVASPLLFAGGALGDLALGGTVVTTGHLEARLPAPGFNIPVEDIAAFYPHRYAGIASSYHRLSVAVGGASRVRSWLGIGLTLELSQVELTESRHIWAGFQGRDGTANPARDLVLTVDGDDGLVPGATIGVLIAPPEQPLEIGLSASYRRPATVEGSASLTRTRGVDGPTPDSGAGQASYKLATPIELRAGLRYLGAHFAVEVNAEVGIAAASQSEATWQLTGVRVIDETNQTAALEAVDAFAAPGDWYRVGASFERELIDGFVWLTAGYAYQSAAQRPATLSPGRIDLDRHTLGLGLEAQWAETTVTIGYARTHAPQRTIDDSAVDMVNPFGPGVTSVGNGSYELGVDTIGVLAEIAWE